MFEARRAGPADADGLMRLRGVMLGSMTGGPALTGDWQRTGAEMLRSRLTAANPALAAFVVDGERGIAACAVGEVDQRLPGPHDPTGLRGYVYNVATDPAYRRRGFSRACMEALLEWFAGRGVGAVDLRASPEGNRSTPRSASPARRRRPCG